MLSSAKQVNDIPKQIKKEEKIYTSATYFHFKNNHFDIKDNSLSFKLYGNPDVFTPFTISNG